MSSALNDFGSKRRYVGPRKSSSKRYYGKRPIISHDFHPSFEIVTCDRSGMSYGGQENGPSMNYETPFGFPRPYYPEITPPPLRSFEELQIERSYLINTLQREDSKATELLKKIRYLQDSCHDPIQGHNRRSLKKQLGHFKNRMCQCTKQEKMILARLGQVTYEIQSKERWNRIENERLQQWNCYGFEQSHLDANFPAFLPHNMYSQQWPVQPVHDSCHYEGYPQPVHSRGGVSAWLPPTIHCEPNGPHELPCVLRSPLSSRVRSSSMVDLALQTAKVKRLSMPELSTGNSEGDSPNDRDRQHLGYDVGELAQ